MKRIVLSLMLLSTIGNIQCKKLRMQGESQTQTGERQTQTIIEAIQNGSLKDLKIWLQKNNPNTALTDELDTALHFAAANNQATIIKLLLNKGARPNLGNKNGLTPLHIATNYLASQAVLSLVKGGADSRAVDKKDRQTSLHYLAEQRIIAIPKQKPSLDIANLLIMKNPNIINALDSENRTALELAIDNNNQKLVQLLAKYKNALEKLMPIKDKKKKLNQTLRNAAKDKDILLVRLALVYGADKTAKNLKRQTAYDIAKKSGANSKMLSLLQP